MLVLDMLLTRASLLAAPITNRFAIRLEDRWEYVLNGDHAGTSIMLRFGVTTPWLSSSYHTASRNAVMGVWRQFFETAVLYEWATWSCEQWMWSHEDGFEPMDYI